MGLRGGCGCPAVNGGRRARFGRISRPAGGGRARNVCHLPALRAGPIGPTRRKPGRPRIETDARSFPRHGEGVRLGPCIASAGTGRASGELLPPLPMASKGRPTNYTPEIAAKICEMLAAGLSLRAICQEPQMPHESTFRQWAREDCQRLLYAVRAREGHRLGLPSRPGFRGSRDAPGGREARASSTRSST